jgi:hypothetical protein
MHNRSVEVSVTSVEAYGHGCVAIDVQLLVSLLDDEDPLIVSYALCC